MITMISLVIKSLILSSLFSSLTCLFSVTFFSSSIQIQLILSYLLATGQLFSWGHPHEHVESDQDLPWSRHFLLSTKSLHSHSHISGLKMCVKHFHTLLSLFHIHTRTPGAPL